MKTSDKIDALAPAYIAAQTELKNATFDKINPHFKSRYATLAQVRDTVTPVLAKHDLAIIQGSIVSDGGACITTRLLHKSGQWIESSYPFSAGKPQEMGSAMTYARRYGLSAICNIASEEDDDGNEGQKSDAFANVTSIPTKTSTRQEFQDLCRVMNLCTIPSELLEWAKASKSRIDQLNPDLITNLRASFDDKMTELKAKAA